MLIAAIVISNQGGFWVTKPCEVIEYMVGDPDRTLELYPACAAYLSGQEGNDTEALAPVEADFNNGTSAAEVGVALEQGFTVGLWLAFFIHAVLVEVYVSFQPQSTVSSLLLPYHFKRQIKTTKIRRKKKGQDQALKNTDTMLLFQPVKRLLTLVSSCT